MDQSDETSQESIDIKLPDNRRDIDEFLVKVLLRELGEIRKSIDEVQEKEASNSVRIEHIESELSKVADNSDIITILASDGSIRELISMLKGSKFSYMLLKWAIALILGIIGLVLTLDQFVKRFLLG